MEAIMILPVRGATSAATSSSFLERLMFLKEGKIFYKMVCYTLCISSANLPEIVL